MEKDVLKRAKELDKLITCFDKRLKNIEKSEVKSEALYIKFFGRKIIDTDKNKYENVKIDDLYINIPHLVYGIIDLIKREKEELEKELLKL